MICFIKNRDLQDYPKSLSLLCYMFYFTVFIKKILQNSFSELLHLLTLHHKLKFRGALKKALMIPEDRSYQTQHFAEIFPSPLASTLHIHFYPHLKESSENTLWIDIGLKSTTFSAPKNATEKFKVSNSNSKAP